MQVRIDPHILLSVLNVHEHAFIWLIYSTPEVRLILITSLISFELVQKFFISNCLVID